MQWLPLLPDCPAAVATAYRGIASGIEIIRRIKELLDPSALCRKTCVLFSCRILIYPYSIMRRVCTEALVVILLFVFLISCSKDSSEEPGIAPSSVRMAIAVDPDGLDPHMSASASTFQVTSNIYETLVTVDENGDIVPCLAESWSIADDGLSMTFTLREGAMFSDGDVCDADAVAASFGRLISPSSARSQDYGFISSVEAVDEHTVRFVFGRLDVTALAKFAYPWSAVVDAAHAGSLRTKPIGSGPYMLSSWIPQQSLILEKNPFYTGECGIDRVEFVIMSDMTSTVTAMKNGQLDIILITGDLAGLFEGDSRFTIHALPTNGLQLMAINSKSNGLDDIRVRMAINHAVDKDALIEAVWWGYGEPIGSHFPVVLSEYIDMNGKYPYDPDKARELLSEAGYGKGELKLRMFLPKNYQEYVNAGQIIADMLRNVGIDVDIQIVEWATWLSDIYNGRNYDLTVVGHTGRLDAYSLLSRYRSDAAENYFNYANDEMDALLDEYVTELDADRRTEIAHRMEEILADDVPALYIQDPIQIYVTDSSLEGFRIYPINIFRMDLLGYK